MATKITKAQRTALEAARDFGSPNRYADASNPSGSMCYPWRASRFAMFDDMKRRGLFEGAYGEYRITEAGREALA